MPGLDTPACMLFAQCQAQRAHFAQQGRSLIDRDIENRPATKPYRVVQRLSHDAPPDVSKIGVVKIL